MALAQLGKYPIEAELGRGAMGVVYRSTHPRLEIPVAIKVLAEQYSSDANFRQRFHREAATVASLNHPGIVRVYDFDEDGPVLFIVMEWVEGRSMRSWLDEYGRFSVDVSVDLLQQLLSAVGVAHDLGVIHRDIKPDNILISNRGKTKILDFGISKLVDDKQRLTATGSMVGTPAYMAPEQVKGEAVDARADIYSLGMILYRFCIRRCSTGRGPRQRFRRRSWRSSGARPRRIARPDSRAARSSPAHSTTCLSPPLRSRRSRRCRTRSRCSSRSCTGWPSPRTRAARSLQACACTPTARKGADGRAPTRT
ncbi:MAG: serine/threonine protein kinase [Chloroflexi bacterium]|nr:MAG: serine/threonine protein kinase [Chloroflexota bacterium]